MREEEDCPCENEEDEKEYDNCLREGSLPLVGGMWVTLPLCKSRSLCGSVVGEDKPESATWTQNRHAGTSGENARDNKNHYQLMTGVSGAQVVFTDE